MSDKIEKSDQAWRRELTPEEFRICRQKGTEAAFSGAYWDTKTPGAYTCTCCGETLFTSAAKFDSGCGWPSFTAPADEDSIDNHSDTTFGMTRTEVTCTKCGAHLGHVFNDGPAPTGQRYCINSASLKLKENE